MRPPMGSCSVRPSVTKRRGRSAGVNERVAAVYEARPASEEGEQPHFRKADGEAPFHEPVRARLVRYTEILGY